MIYTIFWNCFHKSSELRKIKLRQRNIFSFDCSNCCKLLVKYLKVLYPKYDTKIVPKSLQLICHSTNLHFLKTSFNETFSSVRYRKRVASHRGEFGTTDGKTSTAANGPLGTNTNRSGLHQDFEGRHRREWNIILHKSLTFPRLQKSGLIFLRPTKFQKKDQAFFTYLIFSSRYWITRRKIEMAWNKPLPWNFSITGKFIRAANCENGKKGQAIVCGLSESRKTTTWWRYEFITNYAQDFKLERKGWTKSLASLR